MGFYMHAAWFFGAENNFHYNGYVDFIKEVTETYAPFGCPPVTGVDCSPLKPCRFGNVTNEDIHGQERYMHICGRKVDGSRQNCPDEDRYPWLRDPCGGNTPCE